MQSISINEYSPSLGKLINIEEPIIYNMEHIQNSINIPYETLLYQKDKILNKNETYYIYCNHGYKSKRLVNILNTYGYKVIQVII